MSLITLIAILLVAGLLAWLVETAPFVSASWKPIIRWVIIAFVVLWLVQFFLGDVMLRPFR